MGASFELNPSNDFFAQDYWFGEEVLKILKFTTSYVKKTLSKEIN